MSGKIESEEERQVCSDCQCVDYPDCCFGEDSCDTCIDGADGSHKALSKRFKKRKHQQEDDLVKNKAIKKEVIDSKEDLCILLIILEDDASFRSKSYIFAYSLLSDKEHEFLLENSGGSIMDESEIGEELEEITNKLGEPDKIKSIIFPTARIRGHYVIFS
jgi:hypothetical protein